MVIFAVLESPSLYLHLDLLGVLSSLILRNDDQFLKFLPADLFDFPELLWEENPVL